MSVSRRCTLLVLVAVTAFASGCSGLSTPNGPKLWRESADASGAPELARINDLLADLAARLQPGLVYVRVQRAAGAKEEPSREEPSEPQVCGAASDVPLPPLQRLPARCQCWLANSLLATATMSGFLRPPGVGPRLTKSGMVSSEGPTVPLGANPPTQKLSYAVHSSATVRPGPSSV